MSTHKKLNIEASLSRSISQAPGLDFDKLAAIPVVKMTEHDYITRQTPAPAIARNTSLRYFKPISMAVAGVLVMIVCITTWFGEFKSPESIIALDANQSVEIVTNKHKEILSVKAFDQNVQALLDEEHLNQTNLEESVGVIITAMIKNGYLDENKSVVMITVENQNTAKADDLATTLNQVIKESATAENISATVVRQTVTPDSQAVTEAEQYSVSTGKLNVMKELIAADSSLTMESLAGMSLADLLTVSKEKAVDLTKVITVDEPEKETKEVTTPAVEDPSVTPPATTETSVDTNGTGKVTTTPDPAVLETPETPVVTSPEPQPTTEPVVTPPEKTPEAVDDEKTPLSEEKTPLSEEQTPLSENDPIGEPPTSE
ncbi:hypothetical protein FXB42_07815 [Acetobacterium wieringae]|uniref:Anti-sigma factor RsgI-like middle domain-containing protein n=1 Tax=Acetobacterium wieringae TaxID=52694 RepID=A0A5D0WNY6_9FIRM|nr:hypothetical protein [Acetobacterium wieringae]TYC85773.1 hypothetical protein FXB42_07815 [Acetobacterium wieringae]